MRFTAGDGHELKLLANWPCYCDPPESIELFDHSLGERVTFRLQEDL